MQILRDTLTRLVIGPATAYAGLTMFPLVGDAGRRPEYATLDEAIDQGSLEIREVSQAGSVPELTVANKGDRAVFLLDGEELVGAKQNRILNVTILVGAGQKIAVPVSCVEQGRWRWKERHFKSASRSLFSRARAKKMAQVNRSLRSSGSYCSDQGEIWSDVEAKLASLRVPSATASMSDAFEGRSAEIDEYVNALRPAEHQVGAVFAVDGKVVGAELFDSAATFARLMEKLVRSYALDAIEGQARDAKAPVEEVVRKFLEDMKAAAVERFPAVGEGEQLRLESDTLAGAALFADEHIVHVCVLLSPEAYEPRGKGSSEADGEIPPSLRRRRRRE